LWRRANTAGALATIALGFGFTWAFDQFIKGQQGVYLHRAFFTWCFCVVVIALVSLLTPAPNPQPVDPIIWSPQYAKLPEEEKRRYHGWKDFRIWWLIFVGIIWAIYGIFLWFRFQHPVKMLPW